MPYQRMGPEGVEPPTYCLEGSCSILLSYDPENSRTEK